MVITIIVLLILAGITISAITGNESILEKAKEAKVKTEEATEREQIDLKKVNSKLEPEWDGTVANSFAGGTGSSIDPYLVENGAQLAYLASLVNNGDNFSGKFVSITKSINLGNKEFTPIAYGGNVYTDSNMEVFTKGTIFQGTINGNNNVITGLKINNDELSEIQGQGLIGVLGEYGTVKNIVIYEGNITGWGIVGAVVGASKGIIENCNNSAYIGTKGTECGIVGGIVGLVSGNAKVKNCFNSGTITGNDNAVGGIVGGTQETEDVEITNCYNTGNVTANKNNAGGIVGTQNSVDITNCYNTGTITAKDSRAGGIVGYQNSGNITNCYNSGTIIANVQAAGGIIGRTGVGIVINCYNIGDVIAKSEGFRGIAGGIIGTWDSGTISEVYNSGKVKTVNGESNPRDTVGGIVGLYKSGNITRAYNKGELEGGEIEGEIRTGGVIGEKTGGDVSNTFYYTTDTNLSGIGVSNTDQTGTKKVPTIIDSLNEFLNKISSL